MDHYKIETAQNTYITQKVADVGSRILAFLVDLVIIFLYIIFASFSIGAFDGGSGAEWMLMLIIGLPVLLYFLLWEALWDGRTPGKSAMDLRVVKLDGSNPALSDYLIRWLLRVVDITLTSGSVAVVCILINGRGQRLGDLAAGTTVISERSSIGLDQTLLMEIPEDYQPVYPQVTLLSDNKVQEIKSLYKDALKNSNFRILGNLAEKVSEMLEVTPREKPVQFLEQVLKDYNYFTQK